MKVSDLYRIVEKRSSELEMEILSDEDIDAISNIDSLRRKIKRCDRIITMLRIVGDYTTPKLVCCLKNVMQIKTDGNKILVVTPIETKDICDVIGFMRDYGARLVEQLEDPWTIY